MDWRYKGSGRFTPSVDERQAPARGTWLTQAAMALVETLPIV
jgi:hypothetical protein